MDGEYCIDCGQTVENCICCKYCLEPIKERAEIERLTRERDNWIETSAQDCRNTEYYRGLVVQIGETIGEQAYIADDGIKHPDVLCAKVPELITALQSERDKFKSDNIFRNTEIAMRDEAIAELNNSGLGSALHFAASAMVERDRLKAENERLREALEYYADPCTYIAIAFFGDRPCGDFVSDFSETDELGWKPGKTARAALEATDE